MSPLLKPTDRRGGDGAEEGHRQLLDDGREYQRQIDFGPVRDVIVGAGLPLLVRECLIT